MKQPIKTPPIATCARCGADAKCIDWDFRDRWRVMCNNNHTSTNECATKHRAICLWNNAQTRMRNAEAIGLSTRPTCSERWGQGGPGRRDQTPGKLGRFGAALAGAGHSLQKASCRWLNARFTAKLKAGCSVPSSDIARSMAGYRTADAWEESVGAAPQHPADGPHFA